MQFLRVARFERGRTWVGAKYLLAGEFVYQQNVQWILFPDV
jgi:hypothetical protein